MEQVFGLLDLSDLILDYLDHHSLGQLRASSLFFKNLVNSYVAAHTAKGTIRGLARVYEQTVPQRWSLKDRPDTVAFDEKLTFVPYFRTPRWSVGKLQPHTHEERHLMLFDSETQVFTRLKMKYVNDEYDEDILAHFHEFPESRSTENSAFAIHNNCLYMFGGWACWFQYNDIWVFDLSTLKWREIIPEGAVRGSDTYWDFMETDVLWCCDTSAAYFVFEDRCYFEDSDEHHGFWVFDFATEKWTIEAFTRIPENKQRLYWIVNTPLPLGQVIGCSGSSQETDGFALIDLKRRTWTRISGLTRFSMHRVNCAPELTVQFDTNLGRNVFVLRILKEGTTVRITTWA